MISEKSENLMEDYKKFYDLIRSDLNSSNVIKNPNYYIQRGNKFLDNGQENPKNYDEALKNFTKAIELDGEFAENAFYNRAITRLERYCEEVSSNKDQIRKVRDDFIESRKRIKNRETELNIIMQANAMERGNVLSDQVSRKLVILGIQKSAIEQAIGMSDEDFDQQINALNSAKKQKEEEFNKLPLQEKNFDQHQKEIEELEKQKEEFIKRDPKNGVIQKVLGNGNDMKFERFPLKKSFPQEENVKLFDDEISEFVINGFMGKFEVSEIPPIDW
jgi:tetratricopeptide (TPR) repeat protein